VTLLGVVRVERAYYYCPACRAGHSPRDAALGVTAGDLTRGACEAVSLAGTLASFAEAAEKALPKLCGLRVSESTVERATERAGVEVGERLAAGDTFGPVTPWEWGEDAEGKTVGYVSADLTGVRMQGANGARADGRMAAVGMVFNAGVPGQTRYVCALTGGQAGVGDPLRRQAAQVGLDRAQRWVAISDGGAGLEDLLRGHFPRVEVVVLDFFHVAEHLSEWAKAWHPNDAGAAERVAGEWCHRLKREGGAAVLAGLRAVDVSGRSAVVREAHRELLGYFGNQVHRMDYPAYRAKGWLIGSGPVEAACKQVVNQRLKVTGARWSEAGADAVCHLRALFRSEKGQWDAYWASLTA
jgi:hypothetical protein